MGSILLMYNEIRDYLKDSNEFNRKRMIRAIEKNKSSGTISDAANAWLTAYKVDPAQIMSNPKYAEARKAAEKKLAELFRVN